MSSGSTQKQGKRAGLGLVFRIVLSLSLVTWLIFVVDWGQLLAAFRETSLVLVAVSCLLYYVGIVLSSLKWQHTLRIEQIQVSLPRLFGWYMIGAFAGNLLPTDVGGDLGRGYYTVRATGRPLAVARSILVERLSGLICMIGLAWLGARMLIRSELWALLSILGVAGLIVLVVLLRRSPALYEVFSARLPEQARAMISDTAGIFREYRNRPAQVGLIMLLSLAFQLLAGSGLWINLQAVGVDLPLIPVILAAMIVGVIGMLPISINGWGVREAAIIALLTPLGAPAAGVVAGALLARGLTLLLSLPGALFMFYERQPKHGYTT